MMRKTLVIDYRNDKRPVEDLICIVEWNVHQQIHSFGNRRSILLILFSVNCTNQLFADRLIDSVIVSRRRFPFWALSSRPTLISLTFSESQLNDFE